MNIHKHRITETECNMNFELRMAELFCILQDSVETDVSVSMFDHKTMQANGNFFVLMQMIVDMKRMPKAGETISVKTWHAGLDKLYPLRIYEVYDGTGKFIGRVDSVWVILDIVKRRPINPVKAYPEVEWVSGEFKVPKRIKPAEDLKKYEEFWAKYSDIDSNNHVNNTKYIAWVENALGKTPQRLSVNYVAETILDDKITAFKNENQVAFYKNEKLVFIAEFDN